MLSTMATFSVSHRECTAGRRQSTWAGGANDESASELAINGGPKTCDFEWPSWPIWDENEREGLLEVLESGKWWYGEKVAEFERAYASFQGAEFGVSCRWKNGLAIWTAGDIPDSATAPGLTEARERLKLDKMTKTELEAYYRHLDNIVILKDNILTDRGAGRGSWCPRARGLMADPGDRRGAAAMVAMTRPTTRIRR